MGLVHAGTRPEEPAANAPLAERHRVTAQHTARRGGACLFRARAQHRLGLAGAVEVQHDGVGPLRWVRGLRHKGLR